MTGQERFKGKSAVVMGGASGIGEATVRSLHREGAFVAVGDVDPEALGRLEKELGERVVVRSCDVTDEEQVEALYAAAHSLIGPPDCVFTVVGAGDGGLIHELDAATWKRTVEIYLTGVFLSVKHASQRMIAAGRGGAIVNVASVCADLPAVEGAAYCCAKAGVEMLTRVSALETGEYGIRVNTVSPGRVETPKTKAVDDLPGVREAWIEQIPLRSIGTAESIAASLLFLASDEASHISGANLVIDGGFSTTHFESVFRRLRAAEAGSG